MAVTNLEPTQSTSNGIDLDALLTASPANADGEETFNGGNILFYVRNLAVATQTATFVTQGSLDGNAVADKDVAVAQDQIMCIGPLEPGIYNDASNKVQITFDAVLTLEIIAVRA